MKILKFSVLVAALVLASTGRAASPFEVNAVSTFPSPLNVTQDYSSFPDLVSDVVKSQGAFSSFYSSDNFFARVTFLGVADALHVNYSSVPGSVSVRVQSPITSLDQTFTGPTNDDVETQIRTTSCRTAPARSASSWPPSPSSPPSP